MDNGWNFPPDQTKERKNRKQDAATCDALTWKTENRPKCAVAVKHYPNGGREGGRELKKQNDNDNKKNIYTF